MSPPRSPILGFALPESLRPVIETGPALGGGGSFPPAASPEGGDVQVIASGWRLALREFLSNRLAVVGLGVLVFFVLFCFLGPLVYHTNQTVTNPLISDLPPGAGHPLGTDDNGFDELGRIMAGGQTALAIGFFAAFIATVIGTLWRAIAGLAGGGIY